MWNGLVAGWIAFLGLCSISLGGVALTLGCFGMTSFWVGCGAGFLYWCGLADAVCLRWVCVVSSLVAVGFGCCLFAWVCAVLVGWVD